MSRSRLLFFLIPQIFFSPNFSSSIIDFGCDGIDVLDNKGGKRNSSIGVSLPFDHHSHRGNRISTETPASGFIVSAGYPTQGYPNQKCSVELYAPLSSGLVLHITFVDVDLEARLLRSSQCLRDYLIVTIIDREGREHMSERICGSELPEPARSMQTRARIFFVTSSTSPHLDSREKGISRRGFKLRYDFLREEAILAPPSFYYDGDRRFRDECGGANQPNSLSGEIRSPGYPFTYPRNITCNWLLRVDSQRRLYIRLIDLELSPTVADCDRASLEFVDGYRHGLETGGAWTAVSPSSGGRRKGENEARFCGGSSYYKEEGMKSYLSAGNRVIIRFTTRDNPTMEQLKNYKAKGLPIGFRLVWTEVESLVATSSDIPSALSADETDTPTIAAEQCPGFVCLGGSFCIDAADSVCIERTRLCINETLRCDGIANCAENDHSDESYCYASSPLAFTAFVLFLLALIGILVICIYRLLKRESNDKDESISGKNIGRKAELETMQKRNSRKTSQPAGKRPVKSTIETVSDRLMTEQRNVSNALGKKRNERTKPNKRKKVKDQECSVKDLIETNKDGGIILQEEVVSNGEKEVQTKRRVFMLPGSLNGEFRVNQVEANGFADFCSPLSSKDEFVKKGQSVWERRSSSPQGIFMEFFS